MKGFLVTKANPRGIPIGTLVELEDDVADRWTARGYGQPKGTARASAPEPEAPTRFNRKPLRETPVLAEEEKKGED